METDTSKYSLGWGAIWITKRKVVAEDLACEELDYF